MRDFRERFLFASDAEIVLAIGLAFLAFALLAVLGERRRHRRRDRDRVGFVPWTALFLVCAMIGAGLLAAGLAGLAR